MLGCLLEKEMTTPEYYPLTLNALVNACNQKSNRNPVVSYDESTVLAALDELKANRLVLQSDAARVAKYEEHLGKSLNLVPREMAVICLLLLRGPQTGGELRARAERMYSFGDLGEVSETLQALAEMGLIRQQPRQPGQKEARFMHLLGGEPVSVGGEPAPAEMDVGVSRTGRIKALEDEVGQLREELELLKKAFHDFKQQFE